MSSKVFFLLATCLTLQLVHCVEDGTISVETRQKLRKAIIDTIQAKRQSGEEIQATTRPIEKKIDAALDPIEKDVNVLKLNAKVAEKKAKAQGIDISECEQAVRNGLHNLDKDDVKNCKHLPETEKAGEKVGLIGNEIQSLKNLERTCGHEANPDQCVLKAIGVSAKNTAAHQKEVTAILKKAKPEQANKCIAKNAGSLKSKVEGLRKDWSACLKKHKMEE